ncbi:MAG: DUF1015 domain-containing protein [Oscillospiraceae bacterium]|nr:DUF1015 domain-containing protein [Oscillospiraceae bacterium]
MNDIFTPADILLPRPGTDMTRWAVVACDQFSAQPEYWEELSAFVGEAPSALRLMLPEAYLGAPDVEERKSAMIEAMNQYLVGDVFQTIPNSFIFVERTLPNQKIRRGLVGKLDLEAYDWAPGSGSPVRATEATLPERLPTRVELRRQAALEMPHIVLFIDDPDDRVLGAAEPGETLYDFNLYGAGGHIRGRRVTGGAAEAVKRAVDALPGEIRFAMGDGNHSLAAAKNRWEELKRAGAPMDHPARYALAEVENLRDDAVDFYPIHRVLFDTDEGGFIRELCGKDTGELVAEADAFCKAYIAQHGGTVDYIHGEAEARAMGARPGCAALILPTLPKEELFAHILRSGNYPKKSFSVGHSLDKRWYLECRKITE